LARTYISPLTKLNGMPKGFARMQSQASNLRLSKLRFPERCAVHPVSAVSGLYGALEIQAED
jgi:hypothetical protein